ncbi:MAG TPA: hypothetical protein P5307_23045 [Pirellulaceae bacterium]|nr:hypothetical protein [Planctomycetales bacterium]MCB9937626.1 hypothetical protein [Planctomycetaceae bacterium]HRX81972.1 hypothetical protein [Pirellulaceae bacterium]
MASDLLQTLANDDVPKRPVEMSLQVHQRLNPLLVTLHLAEFVLQTLPYAFFHFLRALRGACLFSLTGEFRNEGEDHAE